MKTGAEVDFHSNLWTGVISLAENEGTINTILKELRFTSTANIYIYKDGKCRNPVAKL
jgi:hypothetical protein